MNAHSKTDRISEPDINNYILVYSNPCKPHQVYAVRPVIFSEQTTMIAVCLSFHFYFAFVGHIMKDFVK